MECAPVTKLLDGQGWVYEIKLDGYRAIAVKSDRVVNLFSRRHKSFNHQYPHLVEALGELPEDTVVDGEVVALDNSGRPKSMATLGAVRLGTGAGSSTSSMPKHAGTLV
jgi:ATP-dependent DNA ligase